MKIKHYINYSSPWFSLTTGKQTNKKHLNDSCKILSCPADAHRWHLVVLKLIDFSRWAECGLISGVPLRVQPIWCFAATHNSLSDGRDWHLHHHAYFTMNGNGTLKKMSDNNPLLRTINPLVTWISGIQQSKRHINHSAHTDCCWTWNAWKDCCFQNVKTTNSPFVPVRSLGHGASVKSPHCLSRSVCCGAGELKTFLLKNIYIIII